MTKWEAFKGGTTRFVWWVWSPFRLLWNEITGLRTEELRSLASVQAMVMAALGFGAILRDPDIDWFHPVVGITVLELFLLSAIAGYAMKGKIDIAKRQVDLDVSRVQSGQAKDTTLKEET